MTADAADLTTPAARAWIDRWDTQQQGYLPDREERFTALIDAVAEAAGRPDPLVLDLGCGPGSLATRLLDRIPGATVVAVDADPCCWRSARPRRLAATACVLPTRTCGCPAGARGSAWTAPSTRR